MSAKRIPIEQRKEIFATLVATQDDLKNVRDSYEAVTAHFAITEEQLKEIEEEGIDKQWPPLEEAGV
jgi:hypothetical protein